MQPLLPIACTARERVLLLKDSGAVPALHSLVPYLSTKGGNPRL